MKLLGRGVWVFLAGLVVGALAAASFVAWRWEGFFATQYLVQVAGEAETAQRIYQGQGLELAEQITALLPSQVAALRNEWGEIEGADWVLWQVHDVYTAKGTPPPPELQALFDSLPPRASCRVPVAIEPRVE